MKIPEKIRIGGVDYDISVEPQIVDGCRVLYGEIFFGDCKILLSETMNPNHQHLCITMWHEILHGIVNHANLKMPDDEDEMERIIDTMAKGVYQVLQDNGGRLFDLKAVGENA